MHAKRGIRLAIVDNQPAPVLFFGNCDMKLSNRKAGSEFDRDGAFDIPAELIDGLYRYPEAAPALLARLAPLPRSTAPLVLVDSPAVTGLTAIVTRVVIPRLVSKHAAPPQPLAAHPQAAELARLLIAVDPAGAIALIAGLQTGALSALRLGAELAEPTARALGDLWNADECSELDLSFGLGRLQTAMRRIGARTIRRVLTAPHSVLVAPAPGEGHLLLAALDADALWQAGWDTDAEFPADDAALGALLAGTWFDALDLSLSPSFRREQRLPRLAATIASARAASRNPALVIVVGGRVFGEPGDADLLIGADANVASSAQLENTILRGLSARDAGRQ